MKKNNKLMISRENWELLIEYKKTSFKKRYSELLEFEHIGY